LGIPTNRQVVTFHFFQLLYLEYGILAIWDHQGDRNIAMRYSSYGNIGSISDRNEISEFEKLLLCILGLQVCLLLSLINKTDSEGIIQYIEISAFIMAQNK